LNNEFLGVGRIMKFGWEHQAKFIIQRSEFDINKGISNVEHRIPRGG